MNLKNIFLTLAASVAALSLSSFSIVTDDDMYNAGYTEEELDYLKEDVIYGDSGLVFLDTCNVSIRVPKGFLFIDAEQANHLFSDYWGNPYDPDMLGALIPSDNEMFYQVNVAYSISFTDCGYISDDDASTIDYDELLATLKESNAESNKKRDPEQQLSLIGWAATPKYIQGSHTLIWGRTYKNYNGDDVINYDIRLLGRYGALSVNAVISPEDLPEVQEKEELVIKSFTFKKGYTYTDFDSDTDISSDLTIGSLVAGSILAKTGALAKIGAFLLKFWKLILVAIAALGGLIAKLVKGKKDKTEQDGAQQATDSTDSSTPKIEE